MEFIGMIFLTLCTLAAAAYAQYRLPFHTKARGHLWISRTLLIVLGLLFGWVMSQRYAVGAFMELLVFLSAFGTVHIPAAAILFIKRQRGVWQ